MQRLRWQLRQRWLLLYRLHLLHHLHSTNRLLLQIPKRQYKEHFVLPYSNQVVAQYAQYCQLKRAPIIACYDTMHSMGYHTRLCVGCIVRLCGIGFKRGCRGLQCKLTSRESVKVTYPLQSWLHQRVRKDPSAQEAIPFQSSTGRITN